MPVEVARVISCRIGPGAEVEIGCQAGRAAVERERNCRIFRMEVEETDFRSGQAKAGAEPVGPSPAEANFPIGLVAAEMAFVQAGITAIGGTETTTGTAIFPAIAAEITPSTLITAGISRTA